MAEKETIMKLKVNLQCQKCYKKVKKVLCKFPQIRDQAYDEKNNVVIIKVLCCNPEKIRDKICCKGCGVIKTIEIVEPPKPKPKEPEKPKESEKPKPKPEPKREDPIEPEEHPRPKVKDNMSEDKSEPPPPIPVGIPPPGAVGMVPVGMYGVPCYEGRPGGICFQGYGGPPICYDGYNGRPVYDSYGGGRPCYVSRCDQYFSEENASGCSIM